MSHHRHSHAMGVFAIVAAVAFVFGKRTAQWVVGVPLVLGALFFVYVMFRIISGTV